MSSSLIRGKYVICKITGPDSAEVVYDGAVYQRDGEIMEIGKYEDLRALHPDEEVIGSSNHLVMPGLVNDHFHVGLSPFQMGAPDLPLELWGLHRMGARRVDPYLDQLYGAVQMIESGTTTVQAIHSGGRGLEPLNTDVADKVVKAYMDSGMRVSYAPISVNKNSLVAGAGGGEDDFIAQLPEELARRMGTFMARKYEPLEETLGKLEDISAKYGNNRYERVRVIMAPSNVTRCTDDLLEAYKRMATRYNTGIHINITETVYQKLYGLHTWGVTPLQHLQDLGFLGPEVTCGHSVWVTDEDIELMAATGVTVCTNTSSNIRIKSGIAPISGILARGIPIAMGSDEAGLNDDKDLLQEMRLVLKLHRVPGVENVPPTAHQVFQMATVNGARASMFGDRIGALERGKRADIVLMNLRNIEEPYLDPEVSMVDALVHRGRSIDVDTVIVDGEVLMRDRKLTRIDKEGLFKELREALDRPLEPDELERRSLNRDVAPHLSRYLEGTMPADVTPHTIYNART